MSTLSTATILVKGAAASPGVRTGRVVIIHSHKDNDLVQEGDILVTEMTTPDFAPAMKRAAAIVTDKGGRTCHAAIVSRELGVPCIVGTTHATQVLKTGQQVTVDASNGKVYEGVVEIATSVAPTKSRYTKTKTNLYAILANPSLAEKVAAENVDGVGLLRAEFIIAHIGVHPNYMLDHGRGAEFTEKLADGIRTFVKAFHPRQVVYRTSDFKTNEYRNLIGGEAYEPVEENPMIGYRGAFRQLHDAAVFKLETDALALVAKEFPNLRIMIPFVRTPEELANIKKVLEAAGIGDRLWIMVEVPSTVILLDEFLDVGVDGVSIGSNDLTQLTLATDRDNAKFAELFDERNPAVMKSLEKIITTAHKRGVTVSICGQAPSVYPDLTEKLVSWGITSVSVTPDMIVKTRDIIGDVEKKMGILPPQV